MAKWYKGIFFRDMFENVNVETTTWCNRRCEWCPNSVFDRGLRENQRWMPTKLIHKIIDELGAIGYRGKFSPHSYGEPLLDKRIPELIAYARKAMPHANIVLKSNGDLLTPELYTTLVSAGVDLVNVTQYDPVPSRRQRELCDYLDKHPKEKSHFKHESMYPPKPLYNRGGLVSPTIVSNRPRCLLPMSPVVIAWNGDVVLCCNDYLGQVVFGNVAEQGLMDIWRSSRFKKTRKLLRQHKFTLPICKKCVGISTLLAQRDIGISQQ
jgi:cyclic pyranopterin phosphate synthase